MAFGLSKSFQSYKADVQVRMLELVSELNILSSDLQGEAEEAQGEYDERSERWQEGDKAAEVSEWIDSLNTAAENLDEAIEALESSARELDELLGAP